MADSDKVILLKIEVAQAQANANVKKLEASLESLDGRTKEYKLTLKKLQLERAKLNDLRNNTVGVNKKVEASVKKLTKVQQEGKTAVGASTSATLELGRVLSDMPYGIRGVANNLQQLASNLFFMSKATDAATGKTVGFMGAVGSLIKGLAGPAGILIAFQGIIALFDYFSTSTKKAGEETKSFKDEIEDLNSMMEKQSDTTKLVTDNIRVYLKLLKDKRELDKEMSDLDKEKVELDEKIAWNTKEQLRLEEKIKNSKLDTSVVEKKLDAVKNRGLDLENQLVAIYEKGQKALDKYKKTKDDMTAAQEGTVAALKKEKKELQDIQKNVSDSPIIWKTYEAAIQSVQDKIDAITGGKEVKLPAIRDPKESDKEAEDYLDQITKLSKKRELLDAKTQVEKIEIERKYHIESLQRKNKEDREEFVQEAESYKSKLKLFLDYQVKIGKMSQEQANQELSDFDINTTKKLDTMDENFPTLLIRWQDYYTKKAEAAKISEIGTMKPLKDEIKAEFTLQDGLQEYMKLQSSMTSFLSAEYDRQLTIEQNKTNALNNELNQRLLNEDLSKDERERIQLQIGRNDEKLRKKQEAIEKKRFKLNKAANIANATINTYLGASQVIGDETIPSLAKPFVVAATIASGLLQVAAIARQKFQSSAGSGGAIGAAAGRSGGGGEGREFNFNLAGSTQSNQLTQSIAGQLSQPIQAYVVSSEMTSQQQLDLSISNTATIG
jgi:DNA repair exonuclease SbcCD ATPase subunit